MSGDIVIQIIAKPSGDVSVAGNCTDLALVNLILDKIKNQIITARPKEPSLIERL